MSDCDPLRDTHDRQGSWKRRSGREELGFLVEEKLGVCEIANVAMLVCQRLLVHGNGNVGYRACLYFFFGSSFW